MIRYTALIFFLIIVNFSAAQIQIDWMEVYEDQSGDDIQLFAHNKGHCPVTISMDFKTLKNLEPDKEVPIQMVIPNDGEEHLITTLSPKNPKKGSEYYFDFNYALGNTLSTQYDKDFAYTLPFEKGKKCIVGQGYHGKFSHHDIKALDFDMPIGTEVLAARDGIVVATKTDSNKGCKDPKCYGMANYVLIYHSDGTFSSYVHLKKNGALVQAGDQVKAGQTIGYSGNTGWSSGPHLHFEVYLPLFKGRKTIETKFRISEDEVNFLEPKKTYLSK